mgnify:CR=1 FL=1
MADAFLLSIPLAAAIIMSLGLAAFAWWKSVRKVRRLFVLMAISVAFLTAAFWMELSSATLQEKLFWNDLEYTVNVTLPPLFLLYTYTFLGWKAMIRPKNLPFLFIVPVLTLALLWSNEFHHLFYTEVGLSGVPFTAFTHSYGIGFMIHSAYSLGLLLISVLALSMAYIRSLGMHRRQILPVLIASIIPILALAVGLPEFLPLSLTYVFVVGFTASVILLFLGSFEFELFDVVPLALEGVVEAVDDGIIVIDPEGRVLFANDIILSQTGRREEEVYAMPLSAFSPQLPELVKEAREGKAVDLTLPNDGDTVYMVKATPILDSEGSLTSELLTLRDITVERQTSDRLRIANTKLTLLESVTRHDILNQLTVVRGYGAMLARGTAEGKACKRYGEEIASAGASIEQQLRFARDYQSLGVEAPQWQSAEKAVRGASALGLGGSLEVATDLDSVELLADPLLDRVFSIFLDNTARHGNGATEVKVGYRIEGNDIRIVYQDNGVGVAVDEKEHIFEMGHGRGGGLGLYLAREILETSGMHVRENGTPGQGARFEIMVPPDRWRVAATAPGPAGPS